MRANKASAAVLAELVGTFLLGLVVLSVSKSSLGLPYFVSLAAGLVLVVATLLFGRISGAQLNPAITVGLYSLGKLHARRAAVYVVAQVVGGLLASYAATYFSGQRYLSGTHFSAKLLVAEVLGTFLFALAWAAVVYQKLEVSRAAVLVGLAFPLALLAVSSAGAATLNPATALALHSWLWGSSVLGPLVGAVAGFQAYRYVFLPAGTTSRQAA
jgi:glycerol uptake facilitator-like aquaporin